MSQKLYREIAAEGYLQNNIGIIRLACATSVLFSHSYHLSRGVGTRDPLEMITPGFSFGTFAVSVLFFVAGFLCLETLRRHKYLRAYLKAKLKRLLPELMIVTVFLTVVAGPVFTTLSIPSYYTSPGTWRYLLNGIMVLVHDLPGVFSHNVYTSTVNGALWTLPVEFICFVVGGILYLMGFGTQRKKTIALSAVFFLTLIMLYYILLYVPALHAVITPSGLFVGGMLFHDVRDRVPMKWYLAIVFLLLFVTATRMQLFYYFSVIAFFSYIAAWLCFGFRPVFPLLNRWGGRISYGMYLCGFPIQQMIVDRFGGSMNPWINFAIALPLDILCGYALYMLLRREKKKELSDQ